MVTDQLNSKHIIIGTAGHIDHGKTRLVGLLSGVNTDRLPEEKARGISIDLGFAHWEAETDDCRLQFGIVDVPGHERFVKNMVAGATGVNLALLVIAADDGVMLQTREHLEIMDLLGIQKGIIAITKIDLVDAEFVELVQAEIEDVTAGTFLEGCEIVPVSSETGEGIEELKTTITQVASQIDELESDSLFRLPIDRVFSVTGHGTVVTGSAYSGAVHAGETIELLPEGRKVRVRSVESHGVQSEDAGARRRTAINLAGVKADEVSRGMELATAGYLVPTKRLLVELKLLKTSPVNLKDRMELNLHLGTQEVLARVILKGNRLKPGEKCFAELRVPEPVVATYGQRFILRRVSPAITVAGGRILDPCIVAEKRIRDLQASGADWSNPERLERLSTLVSQWDSLQGSPLEAARRAGINTAEYESMIDELKVNGKLLEIGSRDRKVLVHQGRLEGLSKSVMRTVREELEKHQPRRALPRNTFLTACSGIARSELLDAVFSHLIKSKELVQIGSNVGPADAQVQLTKRQAAARDTILNAITAASLAPPTNKVLAETVGQPLKDLQPLFHICEEDGLLIKLSDTLYFSPDAIEQGRIQCAEFLAEHSSATMSELREAWGVSRKFSIPLCEYFDEQQITVRQGDVRVPGPNLQVSLTLPTPSE